jgi:hypothetical protein
MVGIKTSVDDRAVEVLDGKRVGVSAGVGVTCAEQAAVIRTNRGMITKYRLIIFDLSIGKPLKVDLKRV